MLIRESVAADFPAMLTLANDAAHAYRGVIPADRWHEPYMPAEELVKEIADGATGSRWSQTARRTELLRTYWSIPARQVETSVVLADRRWVEAEQV